MMSEQLELLEGTQGSNDLRRNTHTHTHTHTQHTHTHIQTTTLSSPLDASIIHQTEWHKHLIQMQCVRHTQTGCMDLWTSGYHWPLTQAFRCSRKGLQNTTAYTRTHTHPHTHTPMGKVRQQNRHFSYRFLPSFKPVCMCVCMCV